VSTDTDPATAFSGAATAARFVGQRMPRLEDQRMVTGHGQYIDDLNKPGMVHVAFVRSTVARGRIIGLDVSEARRAPGVIAVLTAADINPRAQVGPAGADKTPRKVLADGDVRFVGDVIAMVVAESRYLAEDAAELVSIDIEPDDPVVTSAQALAEGSPRVHHELPSNLSGVLPAKDSAELDGLLDGAAHVFHETFSQHRYVCVPMETRGLVAEWDPLTERLEIVLACQGVHAPRLFYSQVLGLPEDAIHIVMRDVGGSFGQKAFPTREEQAVVVAAMVLGNRPVKWIEDRAENLISGGHAREESLEVIAATDERGVLLAGRAHHIENVGAYPSVANGQMAGTASIMFPGPYHWSGPGSVAYSGQALYTNTCGLCAYRGPWMMETTGREQMVDVIAAKLGIDPLEFRRRNVISRSELPFTNPMSMVYDGVSPEECLDQAAELIGYDQFRKEQEAARAEGRLLGIGLSLYIEPQRGIGPGGSYGATIRIEPSGKVSVYMGTGSHGQSIETTMTQIVADEMGVNVEDVRFVQGDTAATPYGQLTGGSRTAGVAGGTAHETGALMRERVLAVAGQMLEIDPGDLEMANSVARVKGDPDSKGLSLAEIAAAAYLLNPSALPAGAELGLELSHRYQSPAAMYSNACHAVTIEIDRETGMVHILRYVISEDCGEMINPNVVEGQTAGGVVQGIGGVFYEHFRYDDAGNPTTTTFMDYLLPTAAEVPDLEYGHVVTPGLTPGNHKGLGEGGAIASPAALLNAVRDALAPLGVSVNEQPMSPDRILDLIEQGEQAEQAKQAAQAKPRQRKSRARKPRPAE
jgi:aerobic carbon-monoxide dehydrogenase large subunit